MPRLSFIFLCRNPFNWGKVTNNFPDKVFPIKWYPQIIPFQERENCIGCMGVQANIVLSKHCLPRPLPQAEQCQQCYCRPMWCLECMGKWFASRQNQQEPESWMSSTAPCPTCRAKFCMIDVFKI